jgi:hypothetical protein
LAVERFAAGLRAADARLALADVDFARDAVERFGAARFAVERLAAGLRLAVERFAVDRRAGDAPDAPPSSVHLPDITRCAASATASAMIDPSFVALDITLVAACEAVSAASSPASRIARRAFGLALIAAAAAASPAASISLLIAALAILSVISLERDEDFEDDEGDLDDVLLADLAMAALPASREKTLYGCNGSKMKPGNA